MVPSIFIHQMERLRARVKAAAPKPGGEDSALPQAASPLSSSVTSYGRVVLESMAVFRFMAFALGTGLIFGLAEPEEANVADKILVSLAGAYNVLIILGRFNLATRSLVTTLLVMGIEVPLLAVLVLSTGALDSPYLLYSLAPILAASLLTSVYIASLASLVLALSVTGAHVASGIIDTDVPWILDGNYLAIGLLYSVVCLLVSYLPFLANLNWQRRVRAESVSSERQRLRRQVHDNIAQTLAFLSLKARRAEEKASDSKGALTTKDVGDIAGAVEQAYLSVRDYLDGADEKEPGEPLPTRLTAAARYWSRQTGLPVKLQLTEQTLGLSPDVEYQLYQIAREALANVGKHASAGRVWLGLDMGQDGVELRVRDDGRGFASSQPRGHGLQIMQERASIIGASLKVTSSPGQGTEVKVTCPRNGRQGRP